MSRNRLGSIRHRTVPSRARHRKPISPVPQFVLDGRDGVRQASFGLLTASVVATASLEMLSITTIHGATAIALAAETPPRPPAVAWGSGQQSVGNVNLYGPTDPAPARSAPGHVKVVVLGDSYTSGEGASYGSYRTVTVASTDPGYGNNPPISTVLVDPAHQSSTAPALQAVQQLAAQHPDTVFDVVFAPVSGATTESMQQATRPGTPFVQRPQIEAARGADIVLMGISGNDARFVQAAKAGLDPFSSNATATKALDGYIDDAASPQFQAKLTDLYQKVGDAAAPRASIITYGYPQTLPSEYPKPIVPDANAYLADPETVPQPMYPPTAAPFTMSLLNEQTLPRFNQLGATVNNQIKSATEAIAGRSTTNQQWIFADNSQALAGHYLGSFPEGMNGFKPSGLLSASSNQEMYHPNDLGQRDLAKPLLDPLEKAFQRQATVPSGSDPATTPTEPAAPTTPSDQAAPGATPSDQTAPSDQTEQPPPDSTSPPIGSDPATAPSDPTMRIAPTDPTDQTTPADQTETIAADSTSQPDVGDQSLDPTHDPVTTSGYSADVADQPTDVSNWTSTTDAVSNYDPGNTLYSPISSAS